LYFVNYLLFENYILSDQDELYAVHNFPTNQHIYH